LRITPRTSRAAAPGPCANSKLPQGRRAFGGLSRIGRGWLAAMVLYPAVDTFHALIFFFFFSRGWFQGVCQSSQKYLVSATTENISSPTLEEPLLGRYVPTTENAATSRGTNREVSSDGCSAACCLQCWVPVASVGRRSAHHGWGSYDAPRRHIHRPGGYAHLVRNPHTHITVPVKGDNLGEATLAPLFSMQARGLSQESSSRHRRVAVEGYQSTRSPQMRAPNGSGRRQVRRGCAERAGMFTARYGPVRRPSRQPLTGRSSVEPRGGVARVGLALSLPTGARGGRRAVLSAASRLRQSRACGGRSSKKGVIAAPSPRWRRLGLRASGRVGLRAAVDGRCHAGGGQPGVPVQDGDAPRPRHVAVFRGASRPAFKATRRSTARAGLRRVWSRQSWIMVLLAGALHRLFVRSLTRDRRRSARGCL